MACSAPTLGKRPGQQGRFSDRPFVSRNDCARSVMAMYRSIEGGATALGALANVVAKAVIEIAWGDSGHGRCFDLRSQVVRPVRREGGTPRAEPPRKEESRSHLAVR